MEWLFWILLLTVVYVYAGYPLALGAVGYFIGDRRTGASFADDDLPPVTLLISAFNEAGVIERKLSNALESDYPPDLLDIVLISDASDDGTDEIVRRFRDKGIRLLRMPERGGKTLGLNAGVAAASGEIVVFSDANAMYHPAAIRRLVDNFAVADVGAVVGESTYQDSVHESARSEGLYWDYEVLVKKLEGRFGSVVGGDGAIYAVRRDLYRDMRADALSDFVNPLQVIRQGFRCVYEPNAVCVEDAGDSFEKEYRRKVRIVNRAWRALMSMADMLNPLRYGVFSLKLLSHKLLRWLVPFLLTILLLLNVVLIHEGTVYRVTLGLQAACYALALVGYLLRDRERMHWLIKVPYYFVLVNVAAAQGIIESFFGRKYTMWSTARQPDAGDR